MALPEYVDIGSLGRIIQALQDNLKEHARQGADEQTALDSQFIAIGEECGEALGAYRRWRGFARRGGPASDVYEELADVIIVAMVGIVHFAEMEAGACPEDWIEGILAKKLTKIFSRGFVNKDEPSVGLLKIDAELSPPRLLCGHERQLDPDLEQKHAMVCVDYQRKHREIYAQDTTEEPPTRAAYSPGPEEMRMRPQVAHCYLRAEQCASEEPHSQHDHASRNGIAMVHCDGWDPNTISEKTWASDVDWSKVKMEVVNYLDPSPSIEPENNPNGVYKKEANGDWTYIGQSDQVDFGQFQAPFVIALGRTIRDRRGM